MGGTLGNPVLVVCHDVCFRGRAKCCSGPEDCLRGCEGNLRGREDCFHVWEGGICGLEVVGAVGLLGRLLLERIDLVLDPSALLATLRCDRIKRL